MSSAAIIPLVGAYYRPPAQAIIQVLPVGALLLLEHEPTNQHDPNAIRVFVLTTNIPEAAHEELELLAAGFGVELSRILAEPRWQLGYIPKDRAAMLLPYLDRVLAATLMLATDGKPLVHLTIEENTNAKESDQ